MRRLAISQKYVVTFHIPKYFYNYYKPDTDYETFSLNVISTRMLLEWKPDKVHSKQVDTQYLIRLKTI